MPKELCQTQKVADGGLTQLCIRCVSRSSCLIRLSAEMAQATTRPEQERKLFMITECDSFRPFHEEDPLRASLYPQLKRHQIQDCCETCNEARDRSCGLLARLIDISDACHHEGNEVEFTVFTCSSSPHRLYDIEEPDKPQP